MRIAHLLRLVLDGDFEGRRAITGMRRCSGDAQPFTYMGWRERIEEALSLAEAEELRKTG